jgi:DNA-binding transcriptional regulator GbsR (MarR family)
MADSTSAPATSPRPHEEAERDPGRPPGVDASPPRLSELQERFVLHWGEMASAWGIPRSMGQVHALLYISPDPLSTDEVMLRLRISRGNASMSLRALEDWGVIQRVHYRGDRREYFQSLTDVWELFRTIVRERKRREFDPLMRSLRLFMAESASPAEGDEEGVALYRARIAALLEVLETVQVAFEALVPVAPHELVRLVEGVAASHEPAGSPGPG